MKLSPGRFVVALALAAIGVGSLAASAPAPAPREGATRPGETLYAQKCGVCHGATGRGDGPAEFVLFPKPRDLTSGAFKIRSTPTLPTDDDLFGVITRGIPGTSMPGWASLSEGERRDLVAYVKSLAPAFREQRPLPATPIPPTPKPTPALLALGKTFYAEAGCLECHGVTGRGDGEAAGELQDDWGYPSIPYDFTIPGRMKGGHTVRDVYRALQNGIGGTPMPSYGDALSEEETWALAYYVLSLARQPSAPPAVESATVRVRRVTGALPVDPMARLWRRAALQRVPLRTLWLRPEQVAEVRVAAFHNGREVGFLLEWDDPVANQGALGVAEFRDGVAVQFPLHAAALHGAGHPEPSYVMGEPGNAVNIWHWTADSQLDLARRRDREDRYPAVVVDDEPDAHDPVFLTARHVGNPLAGPRRSPVESLNATGLGTLTSQPVAEQVVGGDGRWTDGRWRVVIVRALRTDSPRDAQLAPGESSAVAFAVWDGARRDRDGQKAVSVWQRLVIER
jgi:mono/diheme cytochrome c family protein